MASCEHPTGERFRVCRHLMARPDGIGQIERFTGRGIERDYVCSECLAVPAIELVDACTACRDHAADWWEGIAGEPQIAEEPSGLAFEHRRVSLALPRLVAIQPVTDGERSLWIGLAPDGDLIELDLDRAHSRVVARAECDGFESPQLHVSRDGRFAAVVESRGIRGTVVSLAGGTSIPLQRVNYQAEHCTFPFAFVEDAGRPLFVWSPEWNRLDLADARTGDVVTRRDSPDYSGEQRPEHYLDYFHCGLVVSPDRRWIVDNGWHWHPYGVVVAWSLERWLHENVWESEDGPTRRDLCGRNYYWDGPLCFVDDRHVAAYGYGNDSEWMIPAARILRVDGDGDRWFPGPRGDFAAAGPELYTTHEGTSVWNVARGTRLHHDARVSGVLHPGARSIAMVNDGGIFHAIPRGHAALAPWTSERVRELAARIARERCFEGLPILGDALEEAGCDDRELLEHCHAGTAHADRCWAVDRLTG